MFREPSVAAQNFGPSLERGVGRSSESGFVSGGSSQGGFARASVASGSGLESCLSWLERAFLGSSGLGFSSLYRELLGSSEGFLCLVARATKSSLERACFISADSSDFELQFFISLLD